MGRGLAVDELELQWEGEEEERRRREGEERKRRGGGGGEEKEKRGRVKDTHWEGRRWNKREWDCDDGMARQQRKSRKEVGQP